MWITMRLQVKKVRDPARRRAQDEYLWEYQRRCQRLADAVRATGRRRCTVGEARALIRDHLPTAAIIGVLRQVEEGAQKVWPMVPQGDYRLEPTGEHPDIWAFVLPTHERQEARLPVVVRGRERAILKYARALGAAVLIRNKRPAAGWAVHVTVDVTERKVPPGDKIAGIDAGIKRLAVVWCDGETLLLDHEAERLARFREELRALRRSLQQAGRKKALARLGDREARYAHDLVHQASRRIIKWCRDLGVGTIVMEDLSGIRGKKIHRRGRSAREYRRNLHLWAYAKMQKFISYKARLAGIQVLLVDPAKTSRTCPRCGKYADQNRFAEQFKCIRCGYEDDADVVAARNLVAKAAASHK